MGKPDKIISYEEYKFLLETFDHANGKFSLAYRYPEKAPIINDIKRCIKILEECKNAQ